MAEPIPPPLRSPELAAAVGAMRRYPAAWCIAGGWALDLFLGRRTRAHTDVDVAVLRRDQIAVREHFRGWEMLKVADGALVPWAEGEWLAAPIHEVHARRTEIDPRAVELLLDEAEGDEWLFRRDPAVRLPLGRAILRDPDGIPHLAPEIVLLYKAKAPREHDQHDFAAALPMLGAERRAWLRRALAAAHPAHPWIARLGGG